MGCQQHYPLRYFFLVSVKVMCIISSMYKQSELCFQLQNILQCNLPSIKKKSKDTLQLLLIQKTDHIAKRSEVHRVAQDSHIFRSVRIHSLLPCIVLIKFFLVTSSYIFMGKHHFLIHFLFDQDDWREIDTLPPLHFV